jgi:hypothetical protein
MLLTRYSFIYCFDRQLSKWSQIHFLADSLQSHVVQCCTYYAPRKMLLYGDNFGVVTMITLSDGHVVASVSHGRQ